MMAKIAITVTVIAVAIFIVSALVALETYSARASLIAGLSVIVAMAAGFLALIFLIWGL